MIVCAFWPCKLNFLIVLIIKFLLVAYEVNYLGCFNNLWLTWFRSLFEFKAWLIRLFIHWRRLLNLILFEIYSSQLEESTDSWRAESARAAESEPHQPSTVPLSLSTWPLRFWNLQVTPPKISRLRESRQDICNSLSEVTRNWTPWSRLPSLAVVLFHTSTRPWSKRLKPREAVYEIYEGSWMISYFSLIGYEWLYDIYYD